MVVRGTWQAKHGVCHALRVKHPSISPLARISNKQHPSSNMHGVAFQHFAFFRKAIREKITQRYESCSDDFLPKKKVTIEQKT
jgi:hypothetical protein